MSNTETPTGPEVTTNSHTTSSDTANMAPERVNASHALGPRTAARFGNCELRSCTLTWTGSGEARVFTVRCLD